MTAKDDDPSRNAAEGSQGREGPLPAEGQGPAGEDGSQNLSRDEYEALRKKAEERDLYRNELLRAKADFDNYQKRVRKDRPQWEEQAVRRFLRDLLPVIDNFERALGTRGAGIAAPASLEEGIRLTHQMMTKALADHGVEEIPAQGEPFNPEFHEAVAEEEVADRPSGEIVEVLQKGYRHGEAVLRPSRVKVARNVHEEESKSHADL
jgi:molecular chaperone GrpE